MQIPQTIQAYSQLGLSIQNPRPINNFNQQTTKSSECEFKKLFWLVDGKRTYEFPRTPAISPHTDILLLYSARYWILEFSLTPGCSYLDLQRHSAPHKTHFVLSYYLKNQLQVWVYFWVNSSSDWYPHLSIKKPLTVLCYTYHENWIWQIWLLSDAFMWLN